MTQIIVDEALRTKLNGLNAEIEFRDPWGKTLGYFLPDDDYKKLLYSLDACPYTEEEVRQHMREPGGATLDEIWQRLVRT